MERETILNHIDDYSAEQLFEAIRNGFVSLTELQQTGELPASKRTAIKNLIKSEEDKDLTAWRKAQQLNNKESYERYLSEYPSGIHTRQAEDALKAIIDREDTIRAGRQKIIDKLRKNPNAYSSETIRKYLKEGAIYRQSLVEADIPHSIIERLDEYYTPPTLELGETPESIPEGYTEVYFWGIPSSGKTTALAAVLNTAHNMGYLEMAKGAGYSYMTQLKNVFEPKVAILPPSSPVDNTQYLPFTLKEPKEKHYRSISLIELSGEIFECFFYMNGGKPLPTEDHQKTFDTLLNFLKGNNRKLHFFFVDYDQSNKMDSKEKTQSDYLSAAATFFNDTQYNIFGKTTDAVYIVITKSDLMPKENGSANEQLKSYLVEDNFTAFVNSLKAKCETHSINNKRLLATPFSIGKVYFGEICEFNNETAKNLVHILMRRIPQRKNSILDVFNK